MINNQFISSQIPSDSILNFEKKLYTATSTPNSIEIYYQYIQYLKREKKIEDLNRVINEATDFHRISNTTCDSNSLKLLYEIQLHSYYNKNLQAFVYSFNQIHRSTLNDPKTLRYSDYLNILLLIELHDWEQAKSETYKLWPNSSLQIDTIFTLANTKNWDYKSLKTTKSLSLLPGAGQMYAGHLKEGLVSLILSGTTGSATYYAFNAQYYLLSGLGLFPIFIRVFLGGRAFAIKQTEYRNQIILQSIEQQITNKILDLIHQTELSDE